MNQKFIQSAVLSGLMFGVIAFGNFSANAKDVDNNNDKVVSTNEFYKILDETKPNEVAKIFGRPDKIATLNDAEGDQAGVVWTYEKVVSKKNKILDASFVFVAGEFKYVTLSNS